MTESTTYSQQIAGRLSLREQQVSNTLGLLGDGGTVPFIARYRKELTGSLDEVAIAAIREQHQKLVDVDKRRQTILETLTKIGLLDETLKKQLGKAASLTELEDIYLPYRPKRKTRGLAARERGLEPLAEMLLRGTQPLQLHLFHNLDKGVASDEDALAGARDIIAENFSENQPTRAELRRLFHEQATIESKVVKKNMAQGEKYTDYFDWREPAGKAPGHRLLAMFRGAQEKILTLTIRPPEENALRLLKKRHLTAGPWQNEVAMALDDCYQRLLAPTLENELAGNLKTRADDEAIRVFADNLRQLLLAPPLGQKRVLALDPGYRTGAKVVCLDGQGKLLDTTTIFPTHGGSKLVEAGEIIRELVEKHRIEAISVGNGTAGRETEEFIRALGLDRQIIITLVNEDGASIYSASENARTEFPDQDITVRGAISIGRRLQDPLAELVKIDPKSIGVGQYQHDVNQGELKKGLQDVVESCVNSVGVELNTASSDLLTYVSGLGPTLADNIIAYRNSNGPFANRRELLKVARLGPKAFEQCAGFLRIHSGSNILDASAVHPERYSLVKNMAADAGVKVEELLQSEAVRQSIDLKRYIDDSVGLPTLIDIMAELAKPGRDPRQSFEQFRFAEGLRSMDDLHEGMRLPAIITNVTKFGAFADIGIKQNGLIHVSQLADRFVKDPGEVVKVGQKVEVRVMEIDQKRNRIALSMRKNLDCKA
ncbi:MAG: RNA-binding transcriptional accessory protein [Proteobacteria bacterium]|nr:RNA-binding transcriptional accessory protein [Pseudomonadota bacterium]